MKKVLLFIFLFFTSLPAFAFRDGEVKLINFPYSEELVSAHVRIFNLKFPVFTVPGKPGFFALVSSPLGAMKGDYPLVLEHLKSQLAETKLKLSPRENLNTEEILDAPELNVLPKQAKVVSRVAREDSELKEILTKVSPERRWNKFQNPVNAKINSHFGLYRIYSKHLRRRTHWGVDYHVSVGTPVKASSDGVVVLASDYYFPGKTIVIDHGLGLYTGYSHLSNMSARPGEIVQAGQVIGKSGVSGKVTGAHLHWFAVNGRVKIDPLTLLNINNEL